MELKSLIESIGLLGIAAFVFAESGLFLGAFLPGDSLLFTAGFLASQGILDIRILIPLCFIAAVLGDSFGYAFGRKVGPWIFKREDSLLFQRAHLLRADPRRCRAYALPPLPRLQCYRWILLGGRTLSRGFRAWQYHSGRGPLPAAHHPRDHSRVCRAGNRACATRPRSAAQSYQFVQIVDGARRKSREIARTHGKNHAPSRLPQHRHVSAQPCDSDGAYE